MTYFPVVSPFEIFFDLDGNPLEDGYIYIGEANQNPVTNQIIISWDVNGLYPAAQPIRTIGGYPSRNGTPAKIFVDVTIYSDYSILINDKNQRQIYYAAAAISLTQAYGNTVDYIDDLRSIASGTNTIYVRWHSNINDSGGGDFEWIDGVAPGTYIDDNGITIVPTGGDGSGAWIRVGSDIVITPRQFGAVGDGNIDDGSGTDDYTALQNMFDSIHTEIAGNFSYSRSAYRSKIPKIDMGSGVYKTTQTLTLGGANAHVFGLVILEGTWKILGTQAAAGDFTIELTNIRNCDINMTVNAINGSGIKIDTCKNTKWSIDSGVGGTYDLFTCGICFNNTFDKVLLSQNSYYNGATYGWYGDWTVLTQDTWGGFPINNIELLCFAGLGVGIYWEHTISTGSSGAVEINVIECEGTSSTPAIYISGFERNIAIKNVWSESSADDILYFKDCASVSVSNHLGGGSSGGGRKITVEDCRLVDLKNIYNCNGVNILGTIELLKMDNVELIGTSTRSELISSMLVPVGGAAYKYDAIGSFNFQNVRVIDTSNILINDFVSIRDRGLPLDRNLVLNPWCVDAFGNVTTTYCNTTQDASYTDISPLGFRETLVEISSTTGFARIIPTIDNTSLNELTKATAIIAWKYTPVTGGAEIIQHGIQVPTFKPYGEIIHYESDWIITATTIELDSADTSVTIVWNYAAIYSIGDKFLFGGIVLYIGNDIFLT